MMRLSVALAVALAIGCGNKSPASDADRTTPEGALRAFFGALEAGRIPADLEHYVVDNTELAAWKMRCDTRGCTGGTIQKLEVLEQHDYRAVIAIDYVVRAKGGGRLMGGNRSPITLVREGRNWYVKQWGERRTFRTAGEPAAADDAGPAQPR